MKDYGSFGKIKDLNKKQSCLDKLMIAKFPIIIIASTRSGSSAFAGYIGDLYNTKVWSEPTGSIEEFEVFKRWVADNNKNYVLKIIAHQLVNNEVYQTILSSDCYKIKLTRENKIDHIVSQYIAAHTNIWNSDDKYARGMEYIVDIDKDLVNLTIQHIMHCDEVFNNLDIKFDEEHTYEELITHTHLDDTGIVKIIPPTNYSLLKRVIEKEYDKYR
jgi:hypothetical protein